MMTASQHPSVSPSEETLRGMSDEEEVRRAQAMGSTVGFGEETLVDFEHDLNELGLRP